MYSITFKNESKENDIEKEAKKYLESRMNDLHKYLFTNELNIEDVLNDCDVSESLKDDINLELKDNDWIETTDNIKNLNSNIQDDINEYLRQEFCNYGLDFSYVELGTFEDQTNDYFRYQLSWGGPSDEIRIYEDKIVYVYLDWNCGIGFDVSNDDIFKELRSYFDEMCMLNFDEKRQEYNYYDILYELEETD